MFDLGGQVVTFVTFTLGDDVDNLGIKSEVPTEVAVSGCHFRPLSASETAQISEIDIATQTWKCTAPPVAAALSADAAGYLKYGGDTYTIVGGAQPFTDLEGRLVKVTILAQRQT